MTGEEPDLFRYGMVVLVHMFVLNTLRSISLLSRAKLTKYSMGNVFMNK